jgi:hypothetical protein
MQKGESVPWLFYFSSFEKGRRRLEQSRVVVLKVLTDFRNFMMRKYFNNQLVKWVMVCFYRRRGVLLRDRWCALTGGEVCFSRMEKPRGVLLRDIEK